MTHTFSQKVQYLYEACNMKDGGSITESDGEEYPIRNIGDVKRYIEAQKGL